MNYPNLEKLIDVIAHLRHPEKGCPWDQKQTHETLLKYLIEESYEFLAATEEKSPKKMEDELGDILLQILLHARIGEENNNFNIESIAKNLSDKMIRRHPHVFEEYDKDIEVSQIKKNWQKIKENERGKAKHRIDDGYLKFPALFAADKIGKKTNDLNFDWDGPLTVFHVVKEELDELEVEFTRKKPNHQKIEEELGDLLFSLAQIARHLKLNPEETLRKANKKFIGRFNAMEDLMAEEGVELEKLNQQEMDVFWDRIKDNEKK